MSFGFQSVILALVLSSWWAAARAGEDPVDLQEVTLRGRVILLEESDNSPVGKPQELKWSHRYGLRTKDGDRYRFLPMDPFTKMFSDSRVRQLELQITARLLGDHQLEIVRIHTLHGERLFRIFYYCDVCSITAFAPGACYCCYKEFELREEPVADPSPSLH